MNEASEPLKRLLSLSVISIDFEVSPGTKLMAPDEVSNKEVAFALLFVA